MRNRWKIQLSISWLQAGNGTNTGNTLPVTAELWAAEFLTLCWGCEPSRTAGKIVLGAWKEPPENTMSLLDLLAPDCCTVTND